MSCAAAAASGERSGLTTSWPTPVESRRSMKTSPPWSRRARDPAGERVAARPRARAAARRSEVAPAHRRLHRLGERAVLLVLRPRSAHGGALALRDAPSPARRAARPASADPSASGPRSRRRRRRPARGARASAASTSGRASSSSTHEEDVDRRGAVVRRRPVSDRTSRSIPLREPDRRRRRPADLLDQVVVAAAAAERERCAERLGHELERRARVVVEPADERRASGGTRRRTRPGSGAPRRNAPGTRRRATRRSSARSRARAARGSGFCGRLSKTRSGLVSRFVRVSSSSSSLVLVEPGVQLLEVLRDGSCGRRSSSARATSLRSPSRRRSSA